MFRKLRKVKQELSKKECIEILKNEPRGVLSMIGEDGYPYGVPMNHWYDEKNGKIYFHGAPSGYKVDCIKKCEKVSFCVYDKGYREEGEWALNIRSVVVFGKIHPVEDYNKVVEIGTGLFAKFTNDPMCAQKELAKTGSVVLCLEMEPEYMTGKRVKEE